MPDINTNPLAENINEPAQEKLIDLRPTLFIGIGGTGMEVLLRMRRRILNTLWGNVGSKVRIDSLTDFPVAQFIQFDLDSGAVIDSGKAQTEDLQFDSIKFTEEEKIVESFSMDKYSSDKNALEKYPHVKEWLPLTPEKIRELGIDTNKGAGQMRAVSRLYFFDKYVKIRNKIRDKLKTLKAGLDHSSQLGKLGLKMEASKFRVVVVGSVAGGTGSGAFLDMGWLARWLAGANADVELMLFLPTGYSGANKERTEANGYAALMELESAMRGNNEYVGRWDAYDNPVLSSAPYSEVYLIDSGNVANQHTKNIQDVYHMLADTLFEDFASGDFAKRKRSVAVNQAQHKNFLFHALVPQNRFGQMRLSFSKRYSSLGQSVLDTRQELRRDMRVHLWAGEMLKAFFGVGGGDLGANRATPQNRDEFLSDYVGLGKYTFKDNVIFSDKSFKLEHSSGEFINYMLVETLIRGKNDSMSLDAEVMVEVRNRIDTIKQAPLALRASQVRVVLKDMERNSVRSQDSTADTTEDRITKLRQELLNDYKTIIKTQLYKYLDDKDKGGLAYVLSLVEQLKDIIEAQGDGLVANLQTNAKRFKEIKEALRTREFERLVNSLEETKGFDIFRNNEKQSATVLDLLCEEITNIIKYHLLSKAAEQAAIYSEELSSWLGNKVGVDSNGNAVWNGLMGELFAGRDAVVNMIKALERSSAILQTDIKKEHATLIYIPSTESPIDTPGISEMRAWANEAFADIGGSKVIFETLTDPARKNQIISSAKKIAERQLLALMQTGNQSSVSDPLIEALEQMTSTNRIEVFKKWIACSMPWVDANLTGDFALKSDQYKCFIGVSNDALFKSKFGEQLNSCMPTVAGITSSQLSIVTLGVSGRAVCYTELSGMPLTVLNGIESWRTSYRIESDNSPVHTHINKTQFVHPIAPTTDEIGRLAEDFKYFLLAIITGVVYRNPKKLVPAGQYEFLFGRGDTRRFGNERTIRLDGLPVAYKKTIVDRVREKLDDFDGQFLVLTAALVSFYETHVYTPKLLEDANGKQEPLKGFASSIAQETCNELKEKAIRKGISASEVDTIIDKLLDVSMLDSWTRAIPDSDSDAYDWEVREADEYSGPRLKRIIAPELLLNQNAVRSIINKSQKDSGVFIPTSVEPTPSTLTYVETIQSSSLGDAKHQYYLGLNGQQTGPYPAQLLIQMIQIGTLPLASKVWRNGLAGWVEISSLPELTSLLSPATPANLPPPLN